MRFITLALLLFLASSVHGYFCGLEFMKTFHPNEAPSNCFYIRICAPRRELVSTFHRTDTYITNSTDIEESAYLDHMLGESALMVRSVDATLKFLQKLFSGESEIIEKNGPVWMRHLSCISCEVEIQTVLQGRLPTTYEILAKLCPKQ